MGSLSYPAASLTQPMGVYAILHVASGSRYVGSSVDLRVRRRQHTKRLVRGRHPNPHLQRAWTRYGAGAFFFVVLDYVDEPDELLVAEQQWIDTIRSTGSSLYNIRPVVRNNLGLKFTPASCLRVSASIRGRTHSAETKAAMSLSQRGKTVSCTTRAALSAAHTGKKLSADHRAKIGAALKGYKHSEERNRRISATRNLPDHRIAISGAVRRAWADQLSAQARARRAGISGTVLSVKECAAAIGCTATSVRRFIHDGLLPATLVGQFWVVTQGDFEQARAALLARLNRRKWPPAARKRRDQG